MDGFVHAGIRFQSTLPARGATEGTSMSGSDGRPFQSTLPARGATGAGGQLLPLPPISIHAPREGSDGAIVTGIGDLMDFNPRSPRGERRETGLVGSGVVGISIHAPREGSDGIGGRCGGVLGDFNPRSPRGERLTGPHPVHIHGAISIHAPREGSDPRVQRGAHYPGISIHAPREGSDAKAPPWPWVAYNFNPRSPRGERLPQPDGPTWPWVFQSTLPARGATST